MKKMSILLLLAAVLTLTACTHPVPEPTVPPTVPTAASGTEPITEPTTLPTTEPVAEPVTEPAAEPASTPYADLIETYRQALSSRFDPAALMQNDLSILLADCCGSDPFANVGYWIDDLDGDGTAELLILSADTLDPFYACLALDLYTLDPNGGPIKLISSTERDRFYCTADGYFANVSSAGADYSYETTLRCDGCEMTDMTFSTPESSYAIPGFTRFS